MAITAQSGGAAGPSGTLRDQLLALTLKNGYLRSEEPFRLSSGGMSHDYVDMRRAVSSGPDLSLAADAVIEALAKAGHDFDAIGGMTMGADPVAHAVAMRSNKHWYSVRKAEKEHGSKRRIEGSQVEAGTRAVVFEDTTSTGRSILEALEVVRDSGATIVCALTLLDRGELAAEAFRRSDVPYLALLSYLDLGIDPIG